MASWLDNRRIVECTRCEPVIGTKVLTVHFGFGIIRQRRAAIPAETPRYSKGFLDRFDLALGYDEITRRNFCPG